jgi:hypothetical protein
MHEARISSIKSAQRHIISFKETIDIIGRGHSILPTSLRFSQRGSNHQCFQVSPHRARTRTGTHEARPPATVESTGKRPVARSAAVSRPRPPRKAIRLRRLARRGLLPADRCQRL